MRSPHRSLLVTVWCLVSGLLLLGGLLALFLFTPLVNLIIQNKVVLLPGTDVAQAWIAPPIRPLLKIYYFNATNAEVCRIHSTHYRLYDHYQHHQCYFYSDMLS